MCTEMNYDRFCRPIISMALIIYEAVVLSQWQQNMTDGKWFLGLQTGATHAIL